MLIFKFKWQLLGGHVHVHVWAGMNPYSLGKCGTLIMTEEEWECFRSLHLLGVQHLWEEVDYWEEIGNEA